MKVGDIIQWFNKSPDSSGVCRLREFKVKITRIKKYKTFESYLRNERLKHTLPVPEVKTIADGFSVYRKYYSVADEKKYGVLAIQMEVI